MACVLQKYAHVRKKSLDFVNLPKNAHFWTTNVVVESVGRTPYFQDLDFNSTFRSLHMPEETLVIDVNFDCEQFHAMWRNTML